MKNRHNKGDIFIGRKEVNKGIVYTIVDVKYWNDKRDIIFGYDVYDTDRCQVVTMNDWWLDDYTEKV